MKLEAFTDVYDTPGLQTTIDFDLPYINKLIGKNYDETTVIHILETLGIMKQGNTLVIPLWRKDLTLKADIAEEIARIDGYDAIESTVPRINLGAISQTTAYTLQKDVRNFLVSRGFYDMYNYSFVNEELMKKCNGSIDETSIGLRNALSEEITHMRPSLIPNLLLSLEKNAREYKNLSLFETGKVFRYNKNTVQEHGEISGVVAADTQNQFYSTQTLVADICTMLNIDTYQFQTP